MQSAWVYRKDGWYRYPDLTVLFPPLKEVREAEGVWFFGDEKIEDEWNSAMGSCSESTAERTIHKGWQLISSDLNKTLLAEKIFHHMKSLWSYDRGNWRYCANTSVGGIEKAEYIEANKGFWVYGAEDANVTLDYLFLDSDGNGKDDQIDSDNDGLSDGDEVRIGTDPDGYNADMMQKDTLYPQMSLLRSKDLNLSLEKTWRHFTGGGRGVEIGVVDSGILQDHPDLKQNIDLPKSVRYPADKGVANPDGDESDATHGTICAGISAARGFNDEGIRGIAPLAKLIALNVFHDPTDANFISALANTDQQVSSNSWGYDSEDFIDDPAIDGITRGIQNGRGGKGIVYVFAAGNEGGDANTVSSIHSSRYVMSVAAIGRDGKRAEYSNFGASVYLSAPGGTSGDGMISTYFKDRYDRNPRYSKASDNLMGTSFATPVVSGVAALLLDANPQLGWRDVQYILASTANKVNPTDGKWRVNAAGFHYNPDYGFGTPNAYKATNMALHMDSLGAEKVGKKTTVKVDNVILDGDPRGIVSRVKIDDNMTVEYAGLWIMTRNVTDTEGDPSLEHRYTCLDDYEITLISPSGTEVVMDYPRTEGKCGNIQNWKYGTHFFLGEPAKGVWKLRISDTNPDYEGVLVQWSLQLTGH